MNASPVMGGAFFFVLFAAWPVAKRFANLLGKWVGFLLAVTLKIANFAAY